MTTLPENDYISQLVSIHASAFPSGWSAEDFSAHMKQATDDVIDIVENNRVLGYVIIRTAIDQAEILTIAVSPSNRQQGVGRSLLQRAEKCALQRGADIMFLEVAVDNLAAIAMYESSGYNRFGTRPGYYRRKIGDNCGRVDAILYQKHLA